MAMVFAFRVLENGPRNFVLQVNGSDTANSVAATRNGQSNGILVAAGYTPTIHFKVRRILYSLTNCVADLQWHATTNVDLAILSGFGDFTLDAMAGKSSQGIWNDAGVGVTGDIDINTITSATVTAGTNPITSAMSLVLFGLKGTGTPAG